MTVVKHILTRIGYLILMCWIILLLLNKSQKCLSSCFNVDATNKQKRENLTEP